MLFFGACRKEAAITPHFTDVSTGLFRYDFKVWSWDGLDWNLRGQYGLSNATVAKAGNGTLNIYINDQLWATTENATPTPNGFKFNIIPSTFLDSTAGPKLKIGLPKYELYGELCHGYYLEGTRTLRFSVAYEDNPNLFYQFTLYP